MICLKLIFINSLFIMYCFAPNFVFSNAQSNGLLPPSSKISINTSVPSRNHFILPSFLSFHAFFVVSPSDFQPSGFV
ncbi:unnamed protein product [Citrullus colocynthis]|uniref:Secreted protein n=1 Tax=Citrullus colocynthis TaxID=252529 RepID=A0ABP0XN80_9ROSI